jgi:NAD(P)-dependent dehydrogenase (short-subunit alcohol dehydrogenase family)
MSRRFQGLTALVSGGSSGIGLATARLLQAEGATLFTAGLEAGPGAPLDSSHVQIDLIAAGSAARLLDQTGPLDVVVLNAGICRPAPIFATTAEDWQRTMDVNLTATFFLLQEAGRRMAERRSGSLVLTASTNSFDGEADLIAYNASKAALLGLVHSAANELGPYGIRVNAVCPGFIRTPLTEAAFQNPEFTKAYFAQLPLGRGGRPEEVAEAIAFLASPQASYITGATLFVDGGQMAAKFGTWKDGEDRFDGLAWTRPIQS